MLLGAQDVVMLQVIHQWADYDVLKDLAWHTCQGHWSVVSWIVVFSFFEDWGYVGTPPVSWYRACGEGRLEYDGQDRCDFFCKFFQHPGGNFVRAAGVTCSLWFWMFMFKSICRMLLNMPLMEVMWDSCSVLWKPTVESECTFVSKNSEKNIFPCQVNRFLFPSLFIII